MVQNLWNIVIKGLIIGATMIVPGASGGTMAMILGIYVQLILAVSSFRKNVRENFIFLLVFALSAGTGLVLFSTPMSWLLEHYGFLVICFFIAVVLCGVPVIGKKSGIEKINFEVVAYMILGAVLVVAISRLPGNIINTQSMVGLLIAGIVSAAALILPGISFSHFLLILGLYDQLLNALKTFELSFLFPLGMGVLTGIVLLSKLLETLMEKYPKQTYMIILGFIIGSIAEVIVKFL